MENLLIVVDDLALPFGTLRLKPKVATPGITLKNIAQLLNTQEYSRLRFGIGSDFPRGGQIDYVLGKFPGGIAIDARDIGSCDRDHQELLPRRHPDYDESINNK